MLRSRSLWTCDCRSTDGSESDTDDALIAKTIDELPTSDKPATTPSAVARKSKRRRRRSVSPPAANVYRLKPRPKSAQREVTVHTNLRDVIGVYTGGPSGRRKGDKVGHSEHAYLQFLDLGECAVRGCVCVGEAVCTRVHGCA